MPQLPLLPYLLEFQINDSDIGIGVFLSANLNLDVLEIRMSCDEGKRD